MAPSLDLAIDLAGIGLGPVSLQHRAHQGEQAMAVAGRGYPLGGDVSPLLQTDGFIGVATDTSPTEMTMWWWCECVCWGGMATPM